MQTSSIPTYELATTSCSLLNTKCYTVPSPFPAGLPLRTIISLQQDLPQMLCVRSIPVVCEYLYIYVNQKHRTSITTVRRFSGTGVELSSWGAASDKRGWRHLGLLWWPSVCVWRSLEVSLLNGDVIEVVIAEMPLFEVCFEARGT